MHEKAGTWKIKRVIKYIAIYIAKVKGNIQGKAPNMKVGTYAPHQPEHIQQNAGT
jgi:hypothetical protein